MYSYTDILKDYDSFMKLMEEAIKEMISYTNEIIDYDTFAKKFSQIMYDISVKSNELVQKLWVLHAASKEDVEYWFLTASMLTISAIRIMSNFLYLLTATIILNNPLISEVFRKRFFNMMKEYFKGFLDFICVLRKETGKLS